MISSISSGFDRLSILIRSYPLPCPLLRRRGREGERMSIVADGHTMAAPQPFWPPVTLSPRHLSGERDGERGITLVGPRSTRGRGKSGSSWDAVGTRPYLSFGTLNCPKRRFALGVLRFAPRSKHHAHFCFLLFAFSFLLYPEVRSFLVQITSIS